MTSYRVENRATRESGEVEASTAGEACDLLGWMIGDCYVQNLDRLRLEAHTPQRGVPAARTLARLRQLYRDENTPTQ